MFCPYCGQPTPNDGLRFCRQCGFRLEGVAQLLANGGVPWMTPPASFSTSDSPRRKGLKTGAKLLLSSVVMFPFILAFAILAVDSPVPLLLPLTIFLAGLARIIYARVLEDAHPPLILTSSPLTAVAAAPSITPTPQPVTQPAPPATHPPRALFAAGSNTNELPLQVSITEQTTGLLKR